MYPKWICMLFEYNKEKECAPIAAHQTDNSAKSSSDNISYLKWKKSINIVWESAFDIIILMLVANTTRIWIYMHFEVLRQMVSFYVLNETAETH